MLFSSQQVETPKILFPTYMGHFNLYFQQLLLEDDSGERAAMQNANSVSGFEVVEAAQQAVEAICPGVVSCADVQVVAARDATVAVGGLSWTVKLGRRDSSFTATRALAENDLPCVTDCLQALISKFAKKT